MDNREEKTGATEHRAAESDLRVWVKPEFRRIELGSAAGVGGRETATDGYSDT
jgi:hypothetical protein